MPYFLIRSMTVCVAALMIVLLGIGFLAVLDMYGTTHSPNLVYSVLTLMFD